MNFETKKAAREAGMMTLKESRQWLLFPKDSAAGMVVKGETFYAGDECEEILSKTEGQRRGLRLRDGSTPVCEVRNWHNSYEAFRVSDFVPKRQRKQLPPTEIDLLLAVFTVNRAAKRYRDSAASQYDHGNHGFAGAAKAKKLALYGCCPVHQA